ncbi:actin-like ATPase domain-containing protein [Mitosporidium daphniae]|uniref:Actin-like ATPase domain-containing protein n=1 Tax=Mitosporidium daphniae TaxID=1485682 RepID=A0A098VUW2_9MICR|nr:actin-like ATPase domain-containing protein [Mitosporidium daphniae]KGG51486.1 actin-like ATPase domain-containing protein [Mitosporidium daphniae]|eukprot:XP_013237936.1 actin-like ATPase domain-containing protein [Mitosporidium daphniae]
MGTSNSLRQNNTQTLSTEPQGPQNTVLGFNSGEEVGLQIKGDDEAESMLLKARRKRKKKQPQRKITSVYITGLPQDVTLDELNEHFKPCGIILPDLETNLPKIKIYEGLDGRPKGDALVIYLKEESVHLAETLLDESMLRPGVKIRVQKATFAGKETPEDSGTNTDLDFQTKRKLRSIHKKLECHCNVIAINIGSSVKVALFDKTSRTFDVILNQESARKTPFCVAVSNSGKELQFGSSAKASDMSVFCDFQILLGCSLDEEREQVEFFKNLNPRTVFEKNKGHEAGISFVMKNDKIPSFPVEELTALFFAHIKGLANATDCIIAAVLDAAELAGLNVIEIIHDITAAALQYSLTVPFDVSSLVPGAAMLENQVLFMDFGHTHTSVSLILYQRNGAPSTKGASRITLLKTKSHFGIGGASIDLAIRDFFYDNFCKQNALNLIFEEGNVELVRIRNILLEEASLAKFKLTAANSVVIFIDSLYEGRSFRFNFTKSDLEAITKDSLVPRFMKPLEQLLNELGYKPAAKENDDARSFSTASFSTLMLIGGTSRVPFIQETLKTTLESYFGKDKVKLGYSVNSDEGPVLGAALKALLSDIKFNVNTIKLFERPTLDTSVVRIDSSDQEPILLWGEASNTQTSSNQLTKKLLIYKNESFSLGLLTGSTPRKPWATINVLNVSESFNMLLQTPLKDGQIFVGNPLASISFSLPLAGARNGMVQIASCNAIQKTNSTVSANSTTSTATSSSDPKKTSATDTSISVPLSFELLFARPPLSEFIKKEISDRMLAFDTFSLLKRAHNSARNTLESNIFALRPLLREWKEAGSPNPGEYFPVDDLLEELYEKLDYGYEVDESQHESIENVMNVQIKAFNVDSARIESFLADGKAAFSEYLKKKEEEERAIREKLAAEAAAREAEEKKKREEAAAELLKNLKEQLEKMNSSARNSGAQTPTDDALPFDLSDFHGMIPENDLGHPQKNDSNAESVTEEAPLYEAPSMEEAPLYEAPSMQEPPLYEAPSMEEAPLYEAPSMQEPSLYETPSSETHEDATGQPMHDEM